MDIPAWALDDRDLWTPQLVADALVHALRVERAMPSRIAPAPLRALSLETDGAGDEWPEEIERFVPTKDDITHCECVRVGFRDEQGRKHPAWLNGVVLGYPDQRRILSRWATWASHGKRARDGVSQTEDEFARDLGISLATLKRKREFAGAIVARSLNDAGLRVWRIDAPPRRKNRSAASGASR
jgi:Zn ribbon nucleic-acid-binding protein